MKRVCVFVALLFLFAAVLNVQFVLAEENDTNNSTTNETIDNSTVEETDVMHYQYGAKVRLLQLERAIRQRVLKAEVVIDILSNRSANISELERIVTELKLLADEAHQEAVNSTFENKNESVQKFIEIKRDAKDLIKEFKNLTKRVLTPEDKREIAKRMSEINTNEIKALREQIKEQIRMLNAHRAEKILEKIGKNDTETVDKIRRGEATKQEAMQKIKEHYSDFSNTQKQTLRRELQDERQKMMEWKMQRIAKAEEKGLMRASERVGERAMKLREMGKTNASRVLEQRADALREKANQIIQNVRIGGGY